jgi:hypothetical protein
MVVRSCLVVVVVVEKITREDNIKMDLEETGWEGVDWSHLVQCRAVVNTVMYLLVPWKAAGTYLTG